MLEAVGHAVSRLIRIRYGAMLLPRGLKRGAWMGVGRRDIQALMRPPVPAGYGAGCRSPAGRTNPGGRTTTHPSERKPGAARWLVAVAATSPSGARWAICRKYPARPDENLGRLYRRRQFPAPASAA